MTVTLLFFIKMCHYLILLWNLTDENAFFLNQWNVSRETMYHFAIDYRLFKIDSFLFFEMHFFEFFAVYRICFT